MKLCIEYLEEKCTTWKENQEKRRKLEEKEKERKERKKIAEEKKQSFKLGFTLKKIRIFMKRYQIMKESNMRVRRRRKRERD